jgi:ATP-dependent DNA helicase RecG
VSVEVIEINAIQGDQILKLEEGHFSDVKSIDVKPAALTKVLSAFANADGGELYLGIAEETRSGNRTWMGFENPEAANGHLQAFQEVFPLGEEAYYSFIREKNQNGLLLKIEIQKSKSIKTASNKIPYIRFGAQSLPVDSSDALERLRRNKGITSFEVETVSADPNVITQSEITRIFITNVVPLVKPEIWLRKQQLIRSEKPTVAGILLFADEPQASLPKRSGIKIYHYKTRDREGTRAVMAFDPISIEGCIYDQIRYAVQKTVEIIESVQTLGEGGLEQVMYPGETLHEIITNAVLHRDYSIADDVHIRIFDNRVEVESPGSLPAHITVANILNERFARNGALVRLINKFPNPPNKDVGEGLNTAFEAMKQLRLKPPIIEQRPNSVIVFIRHERLASNEEIIMDYLVHHSTIANRQAREICSVGSENSMKTILKKMVQAGLIELVPGTAGMKTQYQKKT